MIDDIGIFQYSLEPESYSVKLEGHIVSRSPIRSLLSVLQQLKPPWLKKSEQYIGKQPERVVRPYHSDNERLMVWHFCGQASDVDGEVIINDVRGVSSFGERYLVEITDAIEYDLIGHVIKPLKQRPKNSSSSLALLH